MIYLDTQDEEDFRRTMMGFDGEDEVPGVAAPEAGGDPMEVDSSAGTSFQSGKRLL